jgi:hypothetical protein
MGMELNKNINDKVKINKLIITQARKLKDPRHINTR